MQPTPRGEAPPSRARRWIVAGAIVIGVLGIASCGVLGLLGVHCMQAVERRR